MNYLLDSHLLLWVAALPAQVSDELRSLISNERNAFSFSVASIWELTIKQGLKRPDFNVDPAVLRRGLLDAGYTELPIGGDHALAVAALPLIHRDPFDRILIAQAQVEGMILLTHDQTVASYSGSVRLV